MEELYNLPEELKKQLLHQRHRFHAGSFVRRALTGDGLKKCWRNEFMNGNRASH